MARSRLSSPILGLSLTFLLVSPSYSLNCTSQNFAGNNLYTNCTDLPYLSCYLHWTYNFTKSSLSIAFIAPPAKSDGWIAWAINPNGIGMVGAQSLIAFKDSNGSMTVNTYNISSYWSILPSKLSFEVSDTRAEYSHGVMRIFATVELPEKTTSVNQVWQVGGSVTEGRPERHDFQSENLNSMGTLDLAVANSNGTVTPTGDSNNTAGGQGENGGDARFRKGSVGIYVFMLFLGSFCF